MELKDKLNLVWKFLFLAVFTYGVISMTCCKDSCSSSSESSCCKTEGMATKPCSSNSSKKIYIFSGADTPRTFSPFLITILVALIK